MSTEKSAQTRRRFLRRSALLAGTAAVGRWPWLYAKVDAVFKDYDVLCVLSGFHLQVFKIRDDPRESEAALGISEIFTGLPIPIPGLYFGCATKRLEGSPP